MQGFVIILVLLALMWFLLIRPQRRRQLQSKQLVDQLEVGKEIVTAGGLYGTIAEVSDDEVLVEIAEGVKVRIAKRAVAGVISEDEGAQGFEEEPGGEHESPEVEEPEEESAATLPPN
ncbi:MAG TPA: preprotein translocase subunit YajC [Gaiellaceae bacterium]